MIDFNYLRQWLTSEQTGLSSEVVGNLSALAVLQEVELGLRVLCGTKTPESDHNTTQAVQGVGESVGGGGGDYVRGLSSLPVWAEAAWSNPTDWQQCILN